MQITGHTTIEDVDPEDILIIPELQVRRKGVQESVVLNYADHLAVGKTFPPLKVVRGSNNKFLLYDGFHRRAAYIRNLKNGGTSLPTIEVLEGQLTFDEIEWLAYEANANHGLPLSPKERMDGFKTYMRAGLFKNPNGSTKPLSELAKVFNLRSKSAVWDRIKTHCPHIWRRYYSNEDLSFKQKTGGLNTMETNYFDGFVESLEEMNTKIQALEALGSKRGNELRGVVVRGIEDLSRQLESTKQTLEKLGFTAPDF